MTDQEATTVKLVLELGLHDRRQAAVLCGLLNTTCMTHQFEVIGDTNLTDLWLIAVQPQAPAPEPTP